MRETKSQKLSALDTHRTASLTSLVQREIEQIIINGEMLPGERINEHALAERFQVSRGPIREALRGLEKARLVSVIANRGSFVREISPAEAVQIQETRGLLFSHSVGSLAGRLTKPQKKELLGYIERIDKCGPNDLRDFRMTNFHLHRAIVSFAGNERLAEIYRALSEEALLVRFQYPMTHLDFALANEEHRQILAAVESGDATEARRLAEKHAEIVDRHLAAIQQGIAAQQQAEEPAGTRRRKRAS